jgi:hypothetical protein
MTPVANPRRDLFEAIKQVAETGQGPVEQMPSMGLLDQVEGVTDIETGPLLHEAHLARRVTAAPVGINRRIRALQCAGIQDELGGALISVLDNWASNDLIPQKLFEIRRHFHAWSSLRMHEQGLSPDRL